MLDVAQCAHANGARCRSGKRQHIVEQGGMLDRLNDLQVVARQWSGRLASFVVLTGAAFLHGRGVVVAGLILGLAGSAHDVPRETGACGPGRVDTGR